MGEWLVLADLGEDPNIDIEPADNGSYVALWYRDGYLAKADK